MGQRLVISIIRDNKPIANAYYHWSGYTLSSLELGLNVINFLESYKEGYNNIFKLSYDALLNTGASFGTTKDQKYAEKMAKIDYSNNGKSQDRNLGLISTVSETIEDAQRWSEGDLVIDIDTMKIAFNVYSLITKDEMKYLDIDLKEKREKISKEYFENSMSVNQLKEFAYKVMNSNGEILKVDDDLYFVAI